MPIYTYECVSCLHKWEIGKRMSQLDEPERCSKCDSLGERRPSRANFNGASDWNTQTYNYGLGCYTKSHAEARRIAKHRGLEEVGTESPEKIHAAMDSRREEIREFRWKEAERDKVYE